MPARAPSLLLLFAALPTFALAELPTPVTPECGNSADLSVCPPGSGDWTLWNFTPADFEVLDPAEVPLGIGNGVLPAWQVSTGRWDQVVAVADSGIRWDSWKTVNKIFLNVDELPLPQDSSGAELSTYDADGNGLVNVRDYGNDPRVLITAGDDVADNMLDASDLLATFSDGVDDDGNGYVDDIAGWDFFENDNNAFATNLSNYGDHGTGVMADAAGEAGNGGIGVCPNCAVLPIRVGDSFITTAPHIAQAILFAGTHETASLSMALGGMTNNDLVQAAVDWAISKGTVIVAAAGDETSFHRNWPGALPGVLNVHSITASNRDDIASATSFLRFVNCNNFGGRVDLVATSSNACATGAVAKISGAVALLQSASMELRGERIPPTELVHLLNSTATDVDIPDSRSLSPDPDLFPSYPGWDAFFGWGRIHVGRAMSAVVADAMPPEAQITSPDWYSLHQQADYTWGPDGAGALWESDGLAVEGVVGEDAVSWRLEWGVGTDVPEDAWMSVSEGEGAVDGLLGTIDVGERWAEVTAPPPPPAGCSGEDVPEETNSWLREGDPLEEAGYEPTHTARAYTSSDTITTRYDALDGAHLSLRLTVTDAGGRVSEARRQVFVRRDDRLLPGFPMQLGSSLEPSSALVDLDGDGALEIVQATSHGEVHVLNAAGEELPGWPQTTGPYPTVDPGAPNNHLGIAAWDELDAGELRQNIVGSPAVADLDGDGVLEVVVPTLSGVLHVWSADGQVFPGFPVFVDFDLCDPALRGDDVRTDCGIFGTPALADLDGDGGLDIIVGAMDQHLYAWDATGELLDGFPTFVQAGPDLPDAQGEIARIVSSPALGDLDGDGDLEVVLGTGQTAGSDFAGYGLLYALDHTGVVLDGFPIAIFAGFAGALPYIGEGVVVSPALVDMDGNGDLEIVASAMADPGTVFDHDGTPYADIAAAIPAYGENSNSTEPSALWMAANPSVGDLDGDGVPDVFAGGSGIGYGLNIAAWTRRLEHQHLLMGYQGHDDGSQMRPFSGFPRVVEDIQFFGSPVLADVSGDGQIDVVNGTTYTARAFSEDGSEPAGPWFTGGWAMAGSSVGDLDGDGYLELVASTREGWLFAWRTDGRADGPIEWPMFRHDPRRTGNYEVPLAVQAGPVEVPPGEDDPIDEGCAIGGGASAGWLVVLFAGWRRRRRGER
ncbi:MAG: VCBS repeat-containing protein [Deltaproteobacteria bacterium]|nr:VCBS repeat-containing protein [Deltaproteobacteria bacterium]